MRVLAGCQSVKIRGFSDDCGCVDGAGDGVELTKISILLQRLAPDTVSRDTVRYTVILESWVGSIPQSLQIFRAQGSKGMGSNIAWTVFRRPIGYGSRSSGKTCSISARRSAGPGSMFECVPTMRRAAPLSMHKTSRWRHRLAPSGSGHAETNRAVTPRQNPSPSRSVADSDVREQCPRQADGPRPRSTGQRGRAAHHRYDEPVRFRSAQKNCFPRRDAPRRRSASCAMRRTQTECQSST
jgi:hypothetical protein